MYLCHGHIDFHVTGEERHFYVVTMIWVTETVSCASGMASGLWNAAVCSCFGQLLDLVVWFCCCCCWVWRPVSQKSSPCKHDHLLLIGDKDGQRWVRLSQDLESFGCCDRQCVVAILFLILYVVCTIMTFEKSVLVTMWHIIQVLLTSNRQCGIILCVWFLISFYILCVWSVYIDVLVLVLCTCCFYVFLLHYGVIKNEWIGIEDSAGVFRLTQRIQSQQTRRKHLRCVIGIACVWWKPCRGPILKNS